jgi:hypothetical protein
LVVVVVVARSVLLTNLHPVGKECYSAKLKRVHFSVPAEGTSNKVENRDGELYVELSLVNVVAQGVFVGTWQIRGEEAFNALVPIAQVRHIPIVSSPLSLSLSLASCVSD